MQLASLYGKSVNAVQESKNSTGLCTDPLPLAQVVQKPLMNSKQTIYWL